MNQHHEGYLSRPFFDSISKKREQSWVIPDQEKEVLERHLIDKFGWSRERASQQLGQVLNQVIYLFRTGRGNINCEAIWSEFRWFLFIPKFGKYKPGDSLAPYLVKIVRRSMTDLIGGGPSMERGTKNSVKKRLAAATYGLTIDGSVESPGSEELPGFIRQELIDWQDPQEALIRAEEIRAEKQDLEARIEAKRRFFPLADLRLAGGSIHGYPDYREAIRRAANPARHFVSIDPEKFDRWSELVHSGTPEGKEMRAKTTIASARLLERTTGQSVPDDLLEMFIEMAVAWQGAGRPVEADGRLTRIRRRAEKLSLRW